MAFPNSPANNDIAIVNGINYIYNSSVNTWTRVPVNVLQTANSAFIHANSAFIHANSAFNFANGVSIAANTPSYVANSAAIYANGAFIAANSATDSAVALAIALG